MIAASPLLSITAMLLLALVSAQPALLPLVVAGMVG